MNIFQEKVIPILNQIDNMNATLVPIRNDFYGHSVTVTGLLTGRDIIANLHNHSLGDAVWMSHRILNDDGTKTLDDMTLDDISCELGTQLIVSKNSFLDLIGALNHA